MTAGSFPAVGPIPEAEIWRAALLLARDAAGRVLVQLRDDRADVPGGGRWSLFGGAVEPGEDLAAAACREFREETGVALDPGEIAPLARTRPAVRRDGVLYVFQVLRTVEAVEITLGEGAGFAFLTHAQVEKFPLLPQIRDVFRMAAMESRDRGV